MKKTNKFFDTDSFFGFFVRLLIQTTISFAAAFLESPDLPLFRFPAGFFWG